jgi:hypothetical protein
MQLLTRVTVFAILLAAGAPALACKPTALNPENIARVYPRMVEIFAGRVLELKQDKSVPEYGLVRFAIEEIYKGAPNNATWYRYVRAAHPERSAVMCEISWSIQVDQHVIVFVSQRAGDLWAAQPYGLGYNRDMMDAAMRLIKSRP